MTGLAALPYSPAEVVESGLRDSTLIAAYFATRDDSILAELELRAIHREQRK